MRLSRLFLLGLPATLLASAAAFVAALMWPMNELAWGVFGSGMLALSFPAVALPWSVARERGRRPRLMLGGIAAGPSHVRPMNRARRCADETAP